MEMDAIMKSAGSIALRVPSSIFGSSSKNLMDRDAVTAEVTKGDEDVADSVKLPRRGMTR